MHPSFCENISSTGESFLIPSFQKFSFQCAPLRTETDLNFQIVITPDFAYTVYLFFIVSKFFHSIFDQREREKRRLSQCELWGKFCEIRCTMAGWGARRVCVLRCMPINFATMCNRAFHGRKIHSGGVGRRRPGVGGFGLQIRLVSYLAVTAQRGAFVALWWWFALRKHHANA